MRIIHLLLTTIIFFSSALISEGQTHRLFSSDKDLSSSLINDVFQDSYGMIWIATEDGLNRYDGAKFTVYRRCNDRPNGLAHNFVNSVFEDKDRNLFIGTHNGAQMYNRDDDTFSPPAVFGNVDHYNRSLAFQRPRRPKKLNTTAQMPQTAPVIPSTSPQMEKPFTKLLSFLYHCL